MSTFLSHDHEARAPLLLTELRKLFPDPSSEATKKGATEQMSREEGKITAMGVGPNAIFIKIAPDASKT